MQKFYTSIPQMLSRYALKPNLSANKHSNIFTNELLYETQRQIDNQTAQMIKIHEQLNQLSTSRVESTLFDQVSKQNIKNQILVQQQPRAVGDSFSSDKVSAESDTPSIRPEELKLIDVLRQRLNEQIRINKELKRKLQALIMNKEQLESLNKKMQDQQQQDQEQLRLQQIYIDLRNELYIEIQKQELQYKEFQALLLQVSQNASFDLRQLQESILNYQSFLSEYGVNDSTQDDVENMIANENEDQLQEVLTKSQTIIQQQNTINLLTQQLQYVQQQMTEDDLHHEDLSGNIQDQKREEQQLKQSRRDVLSNTNQQSQSGSNTSTKLVQHMQISYSDKQAVESEQVIDKSIQNSRLSSSVNTTRTSQVNPMKQDSNRVLSVSSIMNHENGSTTITTSQSKHKIQMPPLPSDRSSTINEKSAPTDKPISKSLREDYMPYNVFQRQKLPQSQQSSQIMADSSSLQTHHQPSISSHLHTSQISLPQQQQIPNTLIQNQSQQNYMQASQSYNTQGSDQKTKSPISTSSNSSQEQKTVKQLQQKVIRDYIQQEKVQEENYQNEESNIPKEIRQNYEHTSSANIEILEKSLQYSQRNSPQRNIEQIRDKFMIDAQTSVGPQHLSMVQNYAKNTQMYQSLTPQYLSDPYNSQSGQHQFNPDGFSVSIQTSQMQDQQNSKIMDTLNIQTNRSHQSFAVQTSLLQSQSMNTDNQVNKDQNMGQSGLMYSAAVQTSQPYNSSMYSQGTSYTEQSALKKMNQSHGIQTSAINDSQLMQSTKSQQYSGVEGLQHGQQTSYKVDTIQTTIQTSPIHVVSNQTQKTPVITSKSVTLSGNFQNQSVQHSSQTTAIQTQVSQKNSPYITPHSDTNKISQQQQINRKAVSLQTSQNLTDPISNNALNRSKQNQQTNVSAQLTQSNGIQTSQTQYSINQQQQVIQQPIAQPFTQPQKVDALMQTSNIISFQTGTIQPLQVQTSVGPSQGSVSQNKQSPQTDNLVQTTQNNLVETAIQTSQRPVDDKKSQQINTQQNIQVSPVQPKISKIQVISVQTSQTNYDNTSQNIQTNQQVQPQRQQLSMKQLCNQLSHSAGIQTSQGTQQNNSQQVTDIQLSTQNSMKLQSQQLQTKSLGIQYSQILNNSQSVQHTSQKSNRSISQQISRNFLNSQNVQTSQRLLETSQKQTNNSPFLKTLNQQSIGIQTSLKQSNQVPRSVSHDSSVKVSTSMRYSPILQNIKQNLKQQQQEEGIQKDQGQQSSQYVDQQPQQKKELESQQYSSSQVYKEQQKYVQTPQSRASVSSSAIRSVTPQTVTGNVSSQLFSRPKSHQISTQYSTQQQTENKIVDSITQTIKNDSQTQTRHFSRNKLPQNKISTTAQSNYSMQQPTYQQPFATNILNTVCDKQQSNIKSTNIHSQSEISLPFSNMINNQQNSHSQENNTRGSKLSSIQIPSQNKDSPIHSNIQLVNSKISSKQDSSQYIQTQTTIKDNFQQTVQQKNISSQGSVVNNFNSQATQTLAQQSRKYNKLDASVQHNNKQSTSTQYSQQNTCQHSAVQIVQNIAISQQLSSKQLISQQLNDLQEQLYKSAGLQTSTVSINDKQQYQQQLKNNQNNIVQNINQQQKILTNSISVQTSGVRPSIMLDQSIQSVPNQISTSIQAKNTSESISMQTSNNQASKVDKSVAQSGHHNPLDHKNTQKSLYESIGVQIHNIPKRVVVPVDLKVTDLSSEVPRRPDSKSTITSSKQVHNKIMQSSNIQEQPDAALGKSNSVPLQIVPGAPRIQDKNKVDFCVKANEVQLQTQQNVVPVTQEAQTQIPELTDLLKRLQIVENGMEKIDRALCQSQFTAFNNAIKQNASTQINQETTTRENQVALDMQKGNPQIENHAFSCLNTQKQTQIEQINLTNSNAGMRCSQCNSQLSINQHNGDQSTTSVKNEKYLAYCDNCRIWYEKCKRFESLEDPFQQLNDVAQRLLQALQSGKLSVEQSGELIQTLHLWQAGVETQELQKLTQTHQEEFEQQKRKLEETDEQRKEFRRKAREERERAVELAEKLKIYQQRFIQQKSKLQKQNNAIQELQAFVQQYVTQVQLVLQQLREKGTQEKITRTVRTSSHKHFQKKNKEPTQNQNQGAPDTSEVVTSVINAGAASQYSTTTASPHMTAAADSSKSAQRQQIAQMQTNSVSGSTPPPPSAPFNGRLIFGK